MSLIRVFENETFVIDYDKENKRYRASYFEDNHYQDECWFDEYEDKEMSLSEALEKYNLVECKMTDEEFKEVVDKFNSIGYTSFQLSSEEIGKYIEQAKQDLIEDGIDLEELKNYIG